MTVPRLSDDTLLQKAIRPAIEDRESFADAVSRDSPEGRDALALAERIRGLEGKSIRALNSVENNVARLAFIYAEQWQAGFADSKPGRKYEAHARRYQRLFHEVRVRRWGRTKLEALMASAKSVPVDQLLKTI